MLSLGLESLAPVEVSSEAQLFQAGIECMRAEIELERAIYDAQTFATNMHNYNEIVSSLQKHSSTECLAFAQELLGVSLEADVKESATYKAQAQKITFSRRIYRTLRNWWRKVKRFVRYLYDTIAGWFKREKSPEEKEAEKKIEVAVPAAAKTIEQQLTYIKEAAEGKNITIPAPATGTVTLKLDEAEALEKKQLEALKTCEKVLEETDPEKNTSPEGIKKSLKVKQAVIPVINTAKNTFTAVKNGAGKLKNNVVNKMKNLKKTKEEPKKDNDINVLHENVAYSHSLPD